jgi:hypothetical protein
MDCLNYHRGDKKGRPKKGQKMHSLHEPKEKEKKGERASPSHAKKLSHPHSF